MAKRGRPPKVKFADKKFRVVLNIAFIDHELFADNIFQAIKEYEPLKLAGKCIISVFLVGSEIKPFTQLFTPFRIKKLFLNSITQEIFQKNVEKHFSVYNPNATGV